MDPSPVVIGDHKIGIFYEKFVQVLQRGCILSVFDEYGRQDEPYPRVPGILLEDALIFSDGRFVISRR